MKKTLFTLVLALAVSVPCLFAQFISVEDKSIADWEGLPEEFVFETQCPEDAVLPALKSAKVFADEMYIYALVEPDMNLITDKEWTPFHVYINTDNSDATGGYRDEFIDANADILFESAVFANDKPFSYNPAVFKWWGEVGGEGWMWVNPDVEHDADDFWGAIVGEGELPIGKSQFVDGKIEMQFLRELVPAEWNKDEFGIGFDIMQNWNSVGILPISSPDELNPNGLAHKLQVKVYRGNSVVVDGIAYLLNSKNQTAMVTKAAYSGEIVIPAEISVDGQTYLVSNIGSKAFAGCKDLISVTLEAQTPPAIVSDAFQDCPNLSAIFVPCGCLEAYCSVWKDFVRWIQYEPLPYKLELTVNSTYAGSLLYRQEASTCDNHTIVEAIPNRYFRFLRWSDGVKDNPRTFEMNQDLAVEALFDFILVGNCGKENALTWTLDPETMTLNISGKGELTDNYFYYPYIENLSIGNEVSVIGQNAFAGFPKLKNILLGSSVKVLEEAAFASCNSIETITCYSRRPPTINTNALYGLTYSTIVYVPVDYLDNYLMHDTWGLYEVTPLGASNAETSDIVVTPSDNKVEIVWPSVSDAVTYELVITDKDGNVICTLIFNANGQLTEIAFTAPARNHVPAQKQETGFSFTITGLESSTTYDLTIDAKNIEGEILDSQSLSFSTTSGPQDIEDVHDENGTCTKILRNGQVLIQRGGKLYSMQGQEL